MYPILSTRPHFSVAEASSLIRELYGRSGRLSELPSERDQNFHFRDDRGGEFVLKISNSAESPEVLHLQNAAIAHLRRDAGEYEWPRLVETVSGSAIAQAECGEGSRHYVRMMSYLPGRVFARVKPHTPAVLRSLGFFLGTTDRALSSFQHPGADRDLKWNMRLAALTIRKAIVHVRVPEGRALVEFFLHRFESEIGPQLERLRKSVIHNDANDYNVLVGHAGPGVDRRFAKVSGIIDFGDMVLGHPAVELAVGMAYAIMDKNDPLAAAADIVSGYHEALPLTESELGLLYDLVAMRLCLSVVISAEQRKEEHNNEYLSISEKPAWALLRRWRELHPRLALYVFRDACRLQPCPSTGGVVAWLKEARTEFGPVVNADFKVSPPIVLDLSVASRELSSLTDSDDMQELTAWLFGRLTAGGAEIGVGRYDEARRFYTSDIFKAAGNDSPEWRTVHLGIDLYMKPGSPILAPLDGKVHSTRRNSGRLDYGPTVILEHAVPENLQFFTLYGHLSGDSLAGLDKGRKIRKGDQIGHVGCLSENGGWPPHLHFQVISDMLDKEGDFPGVAPPSRRRVWLSLCPDPNLILNLPGDVLSACPPARSPSEILSLRGCYLGPTLSVSYRRPLKIVRGFRQFLYDEDGQAYLDAVNNVPHVGHCHPRVVAAAREQTAVLNTNTRYLHDYIVEYARRLAETLPEPLRVFYFVCSGSEANDLALRMARAQTKKRGLVVVAGAYHGNLSSLVEISPYKFDGPGGEGAPAHVHPVITPDVYRGPYKHSDPMAGSLYAGHVEREARKLADSRDGLCAFICESLMSCAGQIVYPAGYLEAAFRHVRSAGGVCIADEVQVGFGRVGTHFWGFETQGVVPDIVTMGKPIGNGHPLAAVVTTPEIAASFRTGMEYFNTYGGNPVSCAVGLAVLDVIRDEHLRQNALDVGARLKDGLERLKERHPVIGDVRGLGLFLGVELVLDRKTLAPATDEAAHVVERMKDKKVLVSADGRFRNVLKFKPPLVFARADAERFLETLDSVLGEDALQLDG